jgi:hypothetical protein
MKKPRPVEWAGQWLGRAGMGAGERFASYTLQRQGRDLCGYPNSLLEQIASWRHIRIGSANPAVRTRKHEVVSCSIAHNLFSSHLKIKLPPRSPS